MVGGDLFAAVLGDGVLCFSVLQVCDLCLMCVLGVAGYCYDAVRSWHFELHVCVARYRHELDKCRVTEQCVVAPLERYNLEAKLFSSEVFFGFEDNLQGDLAEGLCLPSWDYTMKVSW